MLAFSIIWLLLAGVVTVFAMVRRSANHDDQPGLEKKDSGNVLTFVAAIYGLALLAGFLYVSKLLVSNL